MPRASNHTNEFISAVQKVRTTWLVLVSKMTFKAILITLYILFLLLWTIRTNAQTKDSSRIKALDTVTHTAFDKEASQHPISLIKNGFIYAGKKTESIQLANTPADIANKSGRQVFAKVPGIFVYDMDGSGNQINISARGLDPHRGWEFNNRKDGILTNSDLYGYPASHYSAPLESIDRIEIVRGTGSLQYGAQFGGMVNYISKQGDTTRKISGETITSVGSYNLLSNYTSIGGKIGKFQYFAYNHIKFRNGYRQNEQTNSNAQSIQLSYAFKPNFIVKLDWSHSYYRYRLPGALTDSMFYANPKQATRSRNYYSPDIHIPSITLNWNIGNNTQVYAVFSAILGNRSSVMFDKPTNIRDTVNTVTNQYNNRQVDIDNYHSYTSEVKMVHRYTAFHQTHYFLAGIQYLNNDLHRRQLGVGTTGSDYDLTLVNPTWGRDIHFKTTNIALYMEHRWQLSKAFSLGAGLRYENGETNLSGTIVYYPGNQVPVSIPRNFALPGANFSLKTGRSTEIYGGIASAYHSMYLKDLLPGSTFERVDPNIKDAKGYNAELGFRGTHESWRWDLTSFALRYNNRFGTIAIIESNGNLITYKTNVGNSFTYGLETFVQKDWNLSAFSKLSIHTATAIFHGRYVSGNVKSGSNNINITGNRIESVPELISRSGLSYRYKTFTASILYSYTGASYADALNTKEPQKTTGAVGLVPSYGIIDLNIGFKPSASTVLKLSINNLTNKQYFTKRPSFYPGPGIWSSDGINGQISFALSF